MGKGEADGVGWDGETMLVMMVVVLLGAGWGGSWSWTAASSAYFSVFLPKYLLFGWLFCVFLDQHCLSVGFPGPSHTSDLKIESPVVTLPGAWRYRVSTGIGRPGVSIL